MKRGSHLVEEVLPERRQTNGTGTVFTGEITYYAPGLGSCGITNTESDYIVALAVDMMNNGANPNTNPLCNQQITIEYNGVSQVATVTDTCQACAHEDLDLTPSLFSLFADQSEGRVSGVSWYFNDPSVSPQ
jgi:hypothetical protein